MGDVQAIEFVYYAHDDPIDDLHVWLYVTWGSGLTLGYPSSREPRIWELPAIARSHEQLHISIAFPLISNWIKLVRSHYSPVIIDHYILRMNIEKSYWCMHACMLASRSSICRHCMHIFVVCCLHRSTLWSSSVYVNYSIFIVLYSYIIYGFFSDTYSMTSACIN